MKRDEDEIRLVEYQKAQDSAEHHNNIMWTLISTGIGFSVTVLYLVWTQSLDITIKLIFLFIGSFVLFYFSFIIEKTNEVKNSKYNICKEIEEKYNLLGQHKRIENLKISNMFSGMSIFRSIKITLWILYIISIGYFFALGIKDFSFFFIISFGIDILAVVGSIVMEIIYWKM